jgi:hypothetical protein
MNQKWIGAFLAVALASTSACKKDLHTSSVAAVLPSEVSSKLSKELLDFVEVLPGDVAGFGYVELGFTVDQLVPGDADYQAMINDFDEMTRRRWGIELKKVRGFGLAMHGNEVALFVELGSGAVIPPSGNDFSSLKLGKLTVLGKPATVNAIANGAKTSTLIKARPEWVKRALGHAAGQGAFFSFASDKLPPDGDEATKMMIAAIEDGTLTAGSAAGAFYATTRPGKMADVRKPIDGGLAALRLGLPTAISQLSSGGPLQAVGGVLAKHYGNALLNGVKVEERGATLVVSLPWRAPQLPALTPAPALAQRVIAPDEWAVAQVDLGAPVLQLLVAVTDVLGAQLDRNALGGELLSSLSGALDIPNLDPRAVTVSVGSSSALASIHGPSTAMRKGVFPILNGQAVAASTTWGLVATAPQMQGALQDATIRPSPALPLAASSKVAGDATARFRAVVDFDRLPAMAKMFVSDVPLRTLEVSGTSTSIRAEVVVKPGKVRDVQALIDGLKQQLSAGVDERYQNRKQVSAENEVEAIAKYHNMKVANRVLTPKVDGDRLTFSYSYEMPENLNMSVLVAGVVGVVAAVAVPAFQNYMDRADDARAVAP